MVTRFSAERAAVPLVAKFAHHMDIRSADAGVNARPAGFGERFAARVDIFWHHA